MIKKIRGSLLRNKCIYNECPLLWRAFLHGWDGWGRVILSTGGAYSPRSTCDGFTSAVIFLYSPLSTCDGFASAVIFRYSPLSAGDGFTSAVLPLYSPLSIREGFASAVLSLYSPRSTRDGFASAVLFRCSPLSICKGLRVRCTPTNPTFNMRMLIKYKRIANKHRAQIKRYPKCAIPLN